MKHSSIVGGSTAKRVINCPGSVKLCQRMPPKPSSKDADTGTLLHNAVAEYMDGHNVMALEYEGIKMTPELFEDKLMVAIELLGDVDPDMAMEFDQEVTVSFGSYLPGAFGSTDLIGRLGNKAIVLDWKFGDGVIVEATENEQLMYYTAAAMRTPELAWVFDGADEIELIIIQPPAIRRWTTTTARIKSFERTLKKAVKASATPEPKLFAGDHCRWCAARPICPVMTGAVDRALRTQIDGLDKAYISNYLKNAVLLEGWINDLRSLALQTLENGGSIPDFKLVQKRGTRKWISEDDARVALLQILPESEVVEMSMVSPAQAEKKLKKRKLDLPEGIVTSVSSGNTLASADDPRPAVLQLGQQLAGLSKLQ